MNDIIKILYITFLFPKSKPFSTRMACWFMRLNNETLVMSEKFWKRYVLVDSAKIIGRVKNK